jgi:hypothetical protein
VSWLLAGPAALAQTTSGSLTGTVEDEAGRPVSEAIVQARSAATGKIRTVLTDERGQYHLDMLPPGEWTVLARLSDGQVSEPTAVVLRLQQTLRLDFTLGEIFSERVTVKAARPLVDAKASAGSFLITGEQASSLPTNGRVLTDLALLEPSVRQTAPGNFAGERGAVFQINGQSGRANSFLVDGLDNTTRSATRRRTASSRSR